MGRAWNWLKRGFSETSRMKKIAVWIGLAVLSFALFSFLSGVAITIILMLMIGLHEYGHLLAAKSIRVRTYGFYFLPIGGVSLIDANQPEQWKKYVIAYGGPLLGLVLCILALAVYYAARYNILNLSPETAFAAQNYASLAVYLWAIINLFNLVVIYPFDGGRIVAALCMGRVRKFEKYLLYISWASMVLALLVTFSFMILIIGVLMYKSIGRLEEGYEADPPLSRRGMILGWIAYLGLVAAFVLCLFLV